MLADTFPLDCRQARAATLGQLLTRGIQPFRGHPCRAYPLQTCLNEPN